MARQGFLVASGPDIASFIQHLFIGLEPLTFVQSLNDAIPLTRSGRFRAVVATLQFGDSRPLELLAPAKESGTPLILVKLTVTALPQSAVDSAFHAARAVGCDAMFDLITEASRVGQRAAEQQLRELILSVAASV